MYFTRMLRIFIAMVLGMHGMDSVGEELFLASGERPELSLEQKFKKSFDDASIVVIGKFKLPKEIPKLNAYAKEEAFLPIKFQVERIIKGEELIKDNAIDFELPISVRGKEAGPPIKVGRHELDSVKRENRRLELELSPTKNDRQAYEAKKLKVRNTLLQSDKYLRDFVLSPIQTGRGGCNLPERVCANHI